MKNLISMREFVLLRNDREEVSRQDFIMCRDYANFLSRQPKLGDFVPCGENGVPLEKPKNYDAFKNELSRDEFDYNFTDCVNYRQALDRVLFKGFEVCNDNEEFTRLKLNNDTLFFITFYKESEMVVSNPSGGNQQYITTIEHLTPYNLELTEKLIKDLEI